ncbi:hypothetical protein [Photobacterium swingsii]|uniref:hypothetical protein n=1 Tax=Photobacterium swingsii TaxID=680026 RepID=UPI00406894A3
MDLEALKKQVLQSVNQQVTANELGKLNQITAIQGHGFAAEEISHLADVLQMRDAMLVGNDLDPSTGRIIKGGADRIVDGQHIQTKFCKTGRECIDACVDNGRLVYVFDGKPQQIEVPSDKYEEAVLNLENRIRKGAIEGVNDPAAAKDIVRKSPFTYAQAKRVAEAGTLESISYDVASGAVVATGTMLLTTLLTYAYSIWSGNSVEEAIEKSIKASIKVGSITFLSQVIAAQLKRTVIRDVLRSNAESIARTDTFKVFTKGVRNSQGIGTNPQFSSNLADQGIVALATVIVLSAFELQNYISNRISGAQAFKNIAVLSVTAAAGVAGSAVGKLAGAKIGVKVGSSLGPYGAALGAAVGSVLASFVAGTITKSILDNFIEDDAVSMLKIFEEAIQDLAKDYLLSPLEITSTVELLKQQENMAELLCFMFYAEKKTQRAYSVAYVLSEKYVEEVITKRDQIVMDESIAIECSERILQKEIEELA